MREILSITEQSGAMHYLGVPITGHCLWRIECTNLEALIHPRFERWQSRALSMMGRVTLVRSILSIIPIFLLSHTIVPRATLLRLE